MFSYIFFDVWSTHRFIHTLQNKQAVVKTCRGFLFDRQMYSVCKINSSGVARELGTGGCGGETPQ